MKRRFASDNFQFSTFIYQISTSLKKKNSIHWRGTFPSVESDNTIQLFIIILLLIQSYVTWNKFDRPRDFCLALIIINESSHVFTIFIRFLLSVLQEMNVFLNNFSEKFNLTLSFYIWTWILKIDPTLFLEVRKWPLGGYKLPILNFTLFVVPFWLQGKCAAQNSYQIWIHGPKKHTRGYKILWTSPI